MVKPFPYGLLSIRFMFSFLPSHSHRTSLATARTQSLAKAPSAGEVGGVREEVLKMCVGGRKGDPRYTPQAFAARVGGGRSDLWSGPSGSSCLEVRDNNRKSCVLWCWGKKSVPDAGEECVQGVSKGQEKNASCLSWVWAFLN